MNKRSRVPSKRVLAIYRIIRTAGPIDEKAIASELANQGDPVHLRTVCRGVDLLIAAGDVCYDGDAMLIAKDPNQNQKPEKAK